MNWRAVLGLGITILLLWWVLRGVDLAVVWAEVRGADFALLALAVAMVTVTFLFRALRWRVLLAPLNSGTSLRSRWAAVNIGAMANNLLPARIGEFARAYALSRLEPISVSGTFGSLVVERFLDGMALVLFMFVAMAARTFPSDMPSGDAALGGIIHAAPLFFGGILVVMVLMLMFPRPLVRMADGLSRFLPRKLARLLVDALEAFLDGLKVFHSPRLLVQAVVWSLVVWAWQSLGFWVALRVYGVAAEPTLAFAFGFHLGGFVPVTLIGFFYAWKLGFTLKEVEASEERVEEAVEEAHPELPRGAGRGD
jgi:uncharacterized protein (TIRG00374 family)